MQETAGVENRRMNFRKYSELDIGRLKLLGNRGDSKDKVRNTLHMLLGRLQTRMRFFPTQSFGVPFPSTLSLFFIDKPKK